MNCKAIKKGARMTTEDVLLEAFPYSLMERARDWLYTLEPNSISTWDEMEEQFLMQYYSPTKTQHARNRINAFVQEDGENLHDAWERFKEYQRMCPHHGMERDYLLSIFIHGLKDDTRRSSVKGDVGESIALKAVLSDLAEIKVQLANAKQVAVRNNQGPPGFQPKYQQQGQGNQGYQGNSNYRPQQAQPKEQDPEIKDMLMQILQGQKSQGVSTGSIENEQVAFKKQLEGVQAHLKILDNQVAQLASSSSTRQQGMLPGKNEMNPREHINAVDIRSGKQLPETAPPHG
ncbi:PREDICTED: uncharacterized protein LOC104822759 [Tarenaya hassleriana]|uniref:uncharacterized protein LOC104822759 n=1 Tax=Tarenaya hassleriana TaxID=28532 RepID=UPI00053C7077|nr:PREDICTED: uncharacterized protein LOC104822759 [Tarenaya hassleriana]